MDNLWSVAFFLLLNEKSLVMEMETLQHPVTQNTPWVCIALRC